MSRRKSPGVPGESVAIIEPKMIVVDSEDARVEGGSWTSTDDADAVGGTVLRNNNPGSYVSFSFIGAALWVRFRFGSDAGKVIVKIDGEQTATVDLYHALILYKYVNLAMGLNPRTKHTVTLTIDSTKNASSTDYYANIDAFTYRKSSGALTIHDIEYIDLINVINTINKIALIGIIEEITTIKKIETISNMPDPTPKGSEGIAFKQESAGAGAWTSPTGFEDPDSAWDKEPDAYDEDTNTSAITIDAVGPKSWSSYIILTLAASIQANKLRFNAYYFDPYINKIDIDVLKDGAWVDVYEGSYDDRSWIEKSFTQGAVTKVQVRFYNDHPLGSLNAVLYEVDVWQVPATGGEMHVMRADLADAPAIYNVTTAVINTEYSQALPANTKKFLIHTRGGAACRLAFETGKVAAPVEPYYSIPANGEYKEDHINPAALTLYFASAAAEVVEIIAWS